MTIVYRKSDRIKIEIDNIILQISPLSYRDKSTIQSLLVSGKSDSVMEGATLTLKLAIKSIKGLQTVDGDDYKLEFDGDKLSDDSLDDLMNIKCHDKITAVCLALINTIPDEFKDSTTGEVLEGVRIIKSGDSEKKE